MGRRLHEERIELEARKVSELLGEREDHMVIRHRQQFRLPLLQPGLGVAGMALGATAVTTGVIGVMLTTAFVAFVQMAAQGCRAASQDVLEGPSMAGGHLSAELFEIGRAV